MSTRARSRTKKRGLSFCPTLVLSKIIEWEAFCRSKIRSRSRRDRGETSMNKSHRRSEEEETKHNHEWETEKRQVQITARVVGETSRSDRTLMVEFIGSEGSEGSVQMSGAPNQGEVNSNILMSLARCTIEEDIDNWCKWMVVPASSHLGLSFQLGQEMLKILLKNLCRSKLNREVKIEEMSSAVVEEVRQILEGGETIILLIMTIKVLTWNIRGLGNLESCGWVRKLLREKCPDIMFIQETKLSEERGSLFEHMWGERWSVLVCPVVEMSGVMMIVWNTDSVAMGEVRFLSSPEWDSQFSNAREVMLSKYNLDHNAILLDCCESQRRPSPFRFELMWLEEPICLLNIKEWWDSFQVEGRPSYKWWCKLKALKEKLKIWNRDVFGRVEDKMKLKLEVIEGIDKKRKQRH
ncbi:hypothetical protein FRX31_020264 [Thalictrum thalictroides]|uniref:Endonuclease/exonuclease/phosphatase domain-containing protein n=1 Tax=Thalictrum thalictroides TaxID=46969 RepID=A0A7J6VYE3_THATH|nr:hypothetical protein FRX31_020264 [Thalictrum thalictroides]